MAILRQGYKQGGQIPRCEKLRIKTDGGTRELQEIVYYDVYCPIAFAGLTINDDQLLDRCIAINLVRSNRFEIVNTKIDRVWFDKEKMVTWEGIKEQIRANFGAEAIKEAYEKLQKVYVPVAGRDWEVWSPLLAIGYYAV